jgi:hypothetical protein
VRRRAFRRHLKRTAAPGVRGGAVRCAAVRSGDTSSVPPPPACGEERCGAPPVVARPVHRTAAPGVRGGAVRCAARGGAARPPYRRPRRAIHHSWRIAARLAVALVRSRFGLES